MSLIKKSELKQIAKENAKAKLDDLNKQLMKLRSQVAMKTLPENPGKIRLIRRTIAKILTKVNSQKLRGGEQKKKA